MKGYDVMGKGLSAITGGTGYVGYALVKLLEEKKEPFRLFLRKDNPIFNGIECEKAFGELSSVEDLVKAFDSVETVYHIAGLVDITNKLGKELWEVNVEGTKNVIAACKKCGVKNLVYVSSVDAIPPTIDGDASIEKDETDVDFSPISEISHFNPGMLEGEYARSKAVATQFVLDSKDDLKCCVVHPSACIGPYDFRGTSSIVTMIKLYLKWEFPVSMDFGMYNFVDVRDVADGMYRAAKFGRTGECYILSGERMAVHDFIKTIAKANGMNLPLVKNKKIFIIPMLPLIEKVFQMANLPPVLNDYSIRKLEENCNFTYGKAELELGYHPRPARESLVDTVMWLKSRDEI